MRIDEIVEWLNRKYKEEVKERIGEHEKKKYKLDLDYPDKFMMKGDSGQDAKEKAEKEIKPKYDKMLKEIEDYGSFVNANDIVWIKESKKPKVPKPPKSIKPKKVKVKKTPRSPEGHKRKLYIPKIMYASLDKECAVMLDFSDQAINELRDIISDKNLSIDHIDWVDITPDPTCRTCGPLDLNGISEYDLFESGGIYRISHPGCDCHVDVFLSDGSVYRITTEDSQANLIQEGTFVEEGETPEDELGATI